MKQLLAEKIIVATTYILYSAKLNKYYIGATTNLQDRIRRHNQGSTKFTSTGIPWELRYQEHFKTIREAKQREFSLKKLKSRLLIEKLIASETDT